MAGHTLAEPCATLTALPQRLRLTPAEAWRIIRDVASHARVVSLSASDHHRTIRHMAEPGMVSGEICDALIACAAQKAGVKKLLTFNVADFRRIRPDSGSIVCEP